jgi:uncharacterized protein involved in outer membrane biogenesis
MRLLGWLLGALATLVVLTALAAWLVPPMLDWTRYRGEIIALASGTLGRSVRIDGPISLTLLPQPVLTAAAVSVDGGDATIAVRSLRLRVALWPLLRGKVAARDLVMRDFDMHVPWPITVPSGAVHRPEWLAAVSARIEHGRVFLGDLVFTDIDADLSTAATTGGTAASGTARLSGNTWHVSLRLSPPGADGSVAIDVALDGQGKLQDTGATLAGQIAGDGTLGGRVTARGPNLAALLPAPAVAFKADGRLTVAGGLAAADDLVVEIGGSPARGAVALRVSPALRLDVALAASRLDLDAWLPTVLRGSGVAVPTGIDLSAEAAQLAGGTLRRLRGAFDIDPGGVEVRDVRAILPGDAEMQLSGQITHPDPAQPHFEGDATLAAPAFRTTLAWLEGAGFGAFSALPQAALRSADLAGHAILDRDQLAVAGLHGSVDGTHLAGTLAVHPGKRLALSAALQADHVDLDAWLPASLPSLAALPARLSAVDADVRLEAKTAMLRGEAIAPFALDATVEAGQVTLRRLEGRAREAQFAASGTLGEGGRIADGRLSVSADQAASLGDLLPALLLQRTPALLRLPLSARVEAGGAPDSLGLRIAAALGDLNLEAQPTLDIATGAWSGPMTLRHPGAPRLAEMLGLHGAPAWLGDGSLALVARVGFSPAGGGASGGGKLSADEFDITAGALHATGRLALDIALPSPLLTGRLSAETLPLPLPYLRAPEPLPLGLLGGWSAALALEAGRVLVGASPVVEHAAATVTLADRVLRLDKATARLGGGALSGGLVLNAAMPTPTLTMTAELSGAVIDGPLLDLPLDITGGTVDGTLSLAASGFAPAGLLSTLHGEAAVSARNGMVTGFDMARIGAALPDGDVRKALESGGGSGFDRLALHCSAERGIVSLSAGGPVGGATLSSPLGEATLSGSVDLPDAAADLRIALRPAMSDPPEIGLRLTGPLDALQRTPELAGVVGWRLAHAQTAQP